MLEKNTKTIAQANIARKLIQQGFKVVDIKPHHKNHDRTAFVFVIEEGFEQKVEEIREIIANPGTE